MEVDQEKLYEEYIKWLETHDKNTPRIQIKKGGKPKRIEEMTKEERYEVRLARSWYDSDIRKMLVDCIGIDIENIPAQYKDKIKLLRGYGLGFEEESTVAETLRIARILKENGVNLSKVRRTKNGKEILLEEIEQEGIDIDEIIHKNGLDGKFEYGKHVKALRSAYNGIATYAITLEEKREAENLGLIRTRVIEQLLRVARILKGNGVDLSQIGRKKNGKDILLKEIKQEGIDIERIIEENKLDGDFNYGGAVQILIGAYNEGRKQTLTGAQRKEAEELGVMKKESAVGETIRIARILRDNGVDLTKVILGKKGVLLEEIEQEGIDVKKIIKENNLNPKYKYGQNVGTLRSAYAGTGEYIITEEEKREAEELGLITKKLMDKESQKQEAIKQNEEAKELCEQYEQLLNEAEKDAKDEEVQE